MVRTSRRANRTAEGGALKGALGGRIRESGVCPASADEAFADTVGKQSALHGVVGNLLARGYAERATHPLLW